jgi:hypothetical protein
MTAAPTYDVKSPAAILAEDVICQSFIQSSSTLAYACLLIRQGKYDLAAHVLHSLEAKPASRFKDMVFYLQAQIGIETGDFSTIKKRLVPRVHQHPNDMVALSLLESCIAREWEAWQREHPAEAALSAALAQSQASAAPVSAAHAAAAPKELFSFAPSAASAPEPAIEHTLFARPEPSPAARPTPQPAALERPAPVVAARPAPVETPIQFSAPEPEPEPVRSTVPLRQVSRSEPIAAPAPSGGPFVVEAGDFGVYQGLASDAQTLALLVWNTATRKLRSAAKRPDLESLAAALPQAIPQPLAGPVRALDGGEIHKICYSFGALTVTTFHSGPEHLGLITGNLSQSLLPMVRAENLFQRQSPLSSAARGTAAGTLGREALEVTSNE